MQESDLYSHAIDGDCEHDIANFDGEAQVGQIEQSEAEGVMVFV